MSDDGSGEALLGGVMMFVGGFVAYRERRRILDTPTATANSAAIGRAELCGVARGDPVELSPLTGTECAYWEAELWEYRKSSNSKWTLVASETSNARHLWLEDKSSRIPILLHKAKWTLDNEFYAESGEPLPDTAYDFLARHERDWNSQRLRVKERRLEEGKALYVLGTLTEARSVVLELVDPKRSSRYARIVSVMGAAGQRAALKQTYRKASTRWIFWAASATTTSALRCCAFPTALRHFRPCVRRRSYRRGSSHTMSSSGAARAATRSASRIATKSR